MEDEKTQEKIYRLNVMRNQLAEIQKQLATIDQLLKENAATAIALDGLSSMKDETLIGLGSGTFAKAKATQDSKVLIDIGSGIIAEKTVAEAKKILAERKANMEKAFAETRQYYEAGAAQLQQLGQEIEAEHGHRH